MLAPIYLGARADLSRCLDAIPATANRIQIRTVDASSNACELLLGLRVANVNACHARPVPTDDLLDWLALAK
jgi:hypothetical protein